MSNASDGRGTTADDFDDDEIEWDDEVAPEDGEGLSPIETLADEGHDIFDRDDD